MWRILYLVHVLQAISFRHPFERRSFLCVVWLSGLIFGFIASFHAMSANVSLMRGFQFDSVSIVRVICGIAFPFGITALAVYADLPWVVYVLSFFKGFCYTFVSVVCLYWFNGGLLMRFLFMFYEIVSIPALYICWLRGISGGTKPFFAECLGWFSFSVLIACIDYRFISIFLPGAVIL